MSRLRRFLLGEHGHVAIMTALMTPVAITLAAFAVDTGSLYVEKREAQMLADLAAISAASRLEDPQGAAIALMAANGVTGLAEGNLTVVPGRYLPDHATAPQARFEAGERPFNAVQVSYRTIGSRYFAGAVIPPPRIAVSAIAGTSAEAGFSIGSRLLALEDGLANALLSGLTGSSISLSVMDYDALLGADIELLSFLDMLATELNLTAGSYSDTLDTQVSVGQVARALSKVASLDGTAKAALAKLAMQANIANAARLRLSSLIGVGGGDARLIDATVGQVAASVEVMELLMTSAIIAGNGKQVDVGSSLSIPGLLAVSVNLAIGEPPQHGMWFMIGSGGELVRTAQTRLAVVAEIGMPGSLLALLGARIRIPLYLELAYGEARLKGVTCPGGPSDVRVAVDARPGIANFFLADVDRSKLGGFANPVARSPAKLVQIPLVSVTGQANAEMSNVSYKTLTFNRSDIDARTVKQVKTKDFVSSLSKSLFSSLSVVVKVELGLFGIPLVILPSNVTSLLEGAIGAAAPALDKVLDAVLTALGISLGQADVRVHGASCGRAVLVQ